MNFYTYLDMYPTFIFLEESYRHIEYVLYDDVFLFPFWVFHL